MSTSDLLLNIETGGGSTNTPAPNLPPSSSDQSGSTASAAAVVVQNTAQTSQTVPVTVPGTSGDEPSPPPPPSSILVGPVVLSGAPTSVVVQVPQPPPPQSQVSQPSTSSYQSSSSSLILPPATASAVVSGAVSNDQNRNGPILLEFMQPLMTQGQGSSSSSSSSSASSSSLSSLSEPGSSSQNTTTAVASTVEQQVADFMKRRFDMMRELGGGSPTGADKLDYYNKRCRTGKSSLSLSGGVGSGSGSAGQLSQRQPGGSNPGGWDDPVTLKQKLEQRLNMILCCAVCIDLPKSSVYQCPNGHLMCAGCFTHVLADARLRDETPTCPNCRIQISKESCSRNLAVEKAVCELPGECRFCQRELPRSMLEKHMTEICEERIVPCRFSNIGCPWNGPFHEADYHANICIHPKKSAREVLDHLEEQERLKREQRKVYETLFTLLSYEKISFQDVQFRPYRTDEYIHKLFYETSRFPAFNLQWVVKARVNGDQRDPTQSCDRHLSFQLCLKSKPANTMTIHYMLLKGPYGETKVLPMIYKFDFTETQTESPYNIVNLATASDSNRLLAARMINFRLIMFQASK